MAPLTRAPPHRTSNGGTTIVKFTRLGISLALVGAGLAAVPGMQAVAAGSAPAAPTGSLVHQMRAEAQGDLVTTRERSTGRIGFLRASGDGDLMPSMAARTQDAAAAKATAYLSKYAAAFGATADQLRQSGVEATRYGWTVTYHQSYRGIPVFGAALRANLDKAGDLTSVNGFAAPVQGLGTTPRVSRAVAGAHAMATVRQDPPGEATRADLRGLRAASSLAVYRVGAVRGATGPSVLAWVVAVTNGRGVNDQVFVDAATGKVLNRFSMADGFATKRSLYDGTQDAAHLEWTDGDAFPGTLTTYQQNLMYDAGNSYWLYANTFGRDSFDGKGSPMVTVENYQDPNDPAYCPNANWNGSRINMCPGSEADDVVSHEWGHAYTQYTSGLIYQWQPGALNESYSDVWGETIDLVNGRHDEGEGDLTTKRPVGECSTHSPSQPQVHVNSPAALVKDCDTGAAFFGPQLDSTGVTGDVVVGTDAVEDGGGTATDGCSAFDNATAVAGKIALVDRGLCPFEAKTRNAQAAGAIALIIGNRDDAPVGMPGDDGADVTIPTVSIGLSDREAIKTALAGGQPVNVTMRDVAGQRVDSYRWLMGEQAPAFGGALRDMWTPTCYGDPGKVTDAQYKCSTDDAGGVHSNSGVPNHGYALLVDGGTYNGVSVAGIGLDKAANLWWRAQDSYLTPTSDFTDMADALDASCRDLTGQPILSLSVKRETPGAPTTPITAADCSSVKAMEDAVQLRTAPSQCNFKPLLRKNAPTACGRGFSTRKVWGDDFEHGLRDWTKAQRLGFAKAHGFPWRATVSAPGRHGDKVAYAPDPTGGNCSGTTGDISSVDTIASPAVTLPGGSSRHLVFQHYVATEAGFDGGNVKIRVNGGKWRLVPLDAYTFNAPNTTLVTGPEGNTDPLAGQAAFTGTDGGQVHGSWGTSVVDLAKAGAHAGDKVKFRFDLGRDGCGGVDGWYLDNVKVVVCKKLAHAHARHEVSATRRS
ncbi:MAG: M4 family metallopeptidase [Nocardioides sp.]